MNADRPGEFDLIREFFAPLAKDPGSLGLTDDAAVLTPRAGSDLVLTKDMLAADVHFFSEDPPEAIAAKALRVNLSDLAAKGAKPRGYLMGLALPSDWSPDWLERFCSGLADDQKAYDFKLLGGDTIRSSGGLLVSITALGEVPSGKAVRRTGARPGDLLFVTGTIGDAAAGLQVRLDPAFGQERVLSAADSQYLCDRYLLPRPRTALTPVLLEYANAAMDVSDGLIADCGHLGRASDVDIVLDLDKVPVSRAIERIKANSQDDFLRCVDGGDDYEILACVSEENAGQFSNQAAAANCPVTLIGRAGPGTGIVTVTKKGSPLHLDEPGGFRHF
ncbi:thiamine-phosphate kinase [uncultured Roseibium sp.]|uniref:thiamine-phosphate kinase n=1 Tax=uncultured Roseibium sp. TaxID=1936171 RepID=UPI002629C34D|nr:thiamine-phosphate kinase [uncultured Roseibium sp.]